MLKKTLIILLFGASCAFAAETYNDFKNSSTEAAKSSKGEFASYKKDIEQEFAEFTKIAREEGDKFAAKVKKEWGDTLVSDNKVWVSYSSDMKTRRLVNFETGEVKIQTKNNKGVPDSKAMAREIADLLVTDSSKAFATDETNANVEKRLKAEGIDAKTDIVAKMPMLADLVTGKKDVTVQEAAKLAVDLLMKGKLATETLANKQPVATFSLRLAVDEPATAQQSAQPMAKGGFAVLKANTTVGNIHKKASAYKEMVTEYAKERSLPDALVYAIIHNESSFNPAAISHVPAYGMMQLVATSGGKEASAVIFGKPTVLAPSYLLNARNNVRLGSIYLSQLYYIYFKNIKDPESRLYCTIAAYNTGPGNVSRAFTNNRNLNGAIGVINGMGAQAVYEKLLSSLPYDETKHYLRKVSTSYNTYSRL